MNFRSIIGQRQIKEHLQAAVETKKISHAYIIHGEKYSGREQIAKAFAQLLQCENAKGEPCESCTSCLQAVSNNHPDIIYVNSREGKALGIDDIRIQLNQTVGIKPYSSPYKIYIIRDCETMTIQAQNALLKTIEEPPAYAVILLLTTNLNAFLPTVLSRCIVLNMKPVPDEEIKKYLMEQEQVTDYRADVCVAFARGNVGRAKRLSLSQEFDQLKSECLSALKYVSELEIHELVQYANKIVEMKLNKQEYLDVCIMWYRDILMYKATNNLNTLIFKEESSAIMKAARRCSYEGLEDVIVAIQKAKTRLEANVNFALTMELLFLEMKEKG